MKIPAQLVRQKASLHLSVFICLFMFGSVDAPFLCGQSDDTETVIRRLEREWAEAQARNDNASLALIIDNAIVYIEYGRVITKGEYLARIKDQSFGTNEVVIDALTVRAFGKTAIVTGTYQEMRRVGGKRTFKRWRFVDTWAYKNNGWVLVAAASAPIAP